jgi:hypothetical protein
VVDVPDGPDVDVWFRTIEFLFGHDALRCVGRPEVGLYVS